MEIQPNNPLVSKVPLEDISAYLSLAGWQTIENDRWFVFKSNGNIQHAPMEIILPRNTDVPDFQIYLASAINTLSALTENSPEEVIRQIRFYDRDVLFVRNLETPDTESIPLRLASKQVNQLKILVAYSASSERDAKPHFNQQLPVATGMVEHYQFGHTFAGSFGYTVESQLIGETSSYLQTSLFVDEVPNEVILPIERRVMERIVRGLIATEDAVNNRDTQPLIQGYPFGFNSNMCRAILLMGEKTKSPIEYNVLWSQKLSPSSDLENVGTIRIDERGYNYLRDAERELRVLQPEYVTVEGMVIGLSSTDDPLTSVGADRSIILRQLQPRRRIRVELGREDYVGALDAHRNWKTVAVTGILQNVAGNWRLSDPTGFKVIR